MKKAYTAPGMRMVRLKADEAVLTACKTWSNANSGAYMPGSQGGITGNCDIIEFGTERCNITGS